LRAACRKSEMCTKKICILFWSVLLFCATTPPIYSQSRLELPDLPLLAIVPPAETAEQAVTTKDSETSDETENSEFTESNNTVVDAQSELEQIQTSIAQNQKIAEKLRTEIEEMNGDRTQQNAALIAAAQRVKLGEIEVGAMEERLAELQASETKIRQHLDNSNIDVATLLAALQRISRTPPPAMIVNPTDALSSARGAILLAEVLPQLTSEAKAVNSGLNELLLIRQEADAEATLLKQNFSVLFEEQLRIATILEARRRGVDKTTSALTTSEVEAEELANRATSLNQLIKVLNDRIQNLGTGTSQQTQTTDTILSNEAVKLALADTSRKVPAFAFTKAKGFLATPSAGVNIVEFGGNDGFGGLSQGLSIVTRAEAQVIAPADGWVIFKGPYLNYGQIVILNTGENYSIVLAGLDQADVEIDQFILRGEPVGKMGSRTSGQTVTTSAGVSRPTLYIEIRNEDGPIDPTGWWAKDDDQTKSG
jgi:septal ring factor EnvC (AmiA/AmiB activator)